MIFAVVEYGIVVNVIVGLPEGMSGIPLDGGDVTIGDRYENGVFIKQSVKIPTIEEQIASLKAQLAQLEASVQ